MTQNTQKIFEVSQCIFELAQVGSRGADLEVLLERLFGVLGRVLTLDVKPKGAIVLLNPRGNLVQVEQHGLRAKNAAQPLGSELDGIFLDYRATAYVTTLCARPGAAVVSPLIDERVLVLPLSQDDRPMGMILVFVADACDPTRDELEFMVNLARALSSLVARCMVNESLQVRELELEDARTDAIHRLGKASEYRDSETGMHVLRMTHVAGAVAKAMGLPEHERELLLITAPMHDVGKIGISDAILLKPGHLTPGEFDAMKKHTEHGSHLLKGDDILFVTARDIAISHHENWDGSGYPSGLSGEAIPLLARICAVADVFDALTSTRPYKAAWPVEQAIDWVRAESGRKFDPAVIDGFNLALPEIIRIRELYRDDLIDPNQVLDLPAPIPNSALSTGGASDTSSASYVAWDDSFSVGIDVIDAHHLYLFSLINDLYSVVWQKFGARRVARVLKQLDEYARIHFRAEEKMMAHHGHAALERQQHQHHFFENKLREFIQELHINPLTAPFDILTYLRDWLVKHILVEDMQLRQLKG